MRCSFFMYKIYKYVKIYVKLTKKKNTLVCYFTYKILILLLSMMYVYYINRRNTLVRSILTVLNYPPKSLK